jgi:Trypsin-like peptidase domain/PQQ-like domain
VLSERQNDQTDSPLALSVVRIYDSSGAVVGAGLVVGPGQVATCAHVVSAAVGGSPDEPAAPYRRVRLDLPLAASPGAIDAVVRGWWPIDRATGVGDVAVLELDTASPFAGRVPPLYRPDHLWGHRFRVVGFPAGMQDGVWTGGELRDRQGTRWLQLQTDPHSPPIAAGFSGAPVWDDEVGAVVGMTVASDVSWDSTTAYLLPIEDVIGVDPRLLPNPYRGLEPFGEEHADLFYGRDEEATRLAAVLDRQPVVAVIGRSGTGKSSLVRAGLLPRLRRQGVRVVELRPVPVDRLSTETLDRLAADIAGLAGGRPAPGVVLFVDQFEELVGIESPGSEPTPAQDLLRRLVALVEAAPRGDGGVASLRVVLTLRWEAMNELLTDDVAATFEHGTISLAPMSRDQLRHAIVGPAARAPGLRFDDGLVERILDDAADEPGQLPLVESLLSQLWEARQGGTLESSAYERLGGVRGAVTRHAERAIADLGHHADEAALHHLFTMLARPDDGAGFVRRPVRLDLLRADHQRVVDRLARSRLVVVGQQPDGTRTVELAHQALIDHWPRLRSWLDQDHDFLVWHQELDRQRHVWEHAGRDDDARLRGVALARAEDWLERRGEDVAGPARDFIAASRQRARRDQRRRRAVLAGLGGVLVLALLLGSLFAYQRRVTASEQATSDSRALAALSADTATSDPAWSILLALAGYDLHPTPEAENALFQRYLTHRSTETVLSGAPGEIEAVDASRDGRWVAARTAGGSVTVWRREPDRPVTTHHLPVGQVYEMELGEDGRILLAGQRGVQVYDIAAGETAWEIPVDPLHVRTVVVGGDGSVALRLSADLAQDPGTLELWDPDGRRLGHVSAAPSAVLEPMGFGPEPQTVVVWDVVPGTDGEGRLVAWDARTDRLTPLVDVGYAGFALAPNGVIVMCGPGPEQRMIRVELGNASSRSVTPLTQSAPCYGPPAVDSEAKIALVGDAAIDLDTGEVVGQAPRAIEEAPVHGSLITEGDQHYALRSDGRSVLITAVVTQSGTLPAQRLSDGTEPTIDRTGLPAIQDGELLPDGEHVLTITGDGAQLVVSRVGESGEDEVATAIRPPPRRPSGDQWLRINDDGTLVADRVSDDTIEIRTLPDLELLSEVTTLPVPDQPTSLSSATMRWDHDRLLTYDGPVAQWWEPSTGELVAELDVHETGLLDDNQTSDFFFAVHPDPALVVVGVVGDPDLHVVQIATGQEVHAIRTGEDVIAAQFQQDSSYFIIMRQGRLIEMWDSTTRERVLGPLPSLGDAGYNEVPDLVVQFLPGNGQYLVGADGQLRWYRAGSAAPERRLDFGPGHAPMSASRDGSVLLVLDHRTSRIVMPPLLVDPVAWRTRLCDVIDERALTDQERALLPAGVAHRLC